MDVTDSECNQKNIPSLNTIPLQGENGWIRHTTAIPVRTKWALNFHFHLKGDLQNTMIYKSIFIKQNKSVCNDHLIEL